MSQFSAYGVNLTPPNPISYAIPGNLANMNSQQLIASLIGDVNSGQNQANVANNQRYGQELGVLGNAALGQQGFYNQAQSQLAGGYGNAIGSLGSSLGNNQTVFQNEQNRLGLQAQQASSSAQQSAVSRGLGNTTIANSMQDQVQRAANDAYANVAAAKAQSDNGVYQNLANLYAAQGSNQANLSAQQGGAYMYGGTDLANAIQGRTDQAPNLGQYASIIQSAMAANQTPSTIRTTNPVSINSPLNGGGMGSLDSNSPGGGGISGGGTQASMGQGGFNSSGGGGSGTSGMQNYNSNAGNPNDNGSGTDWQALANSFMQGGTVNGTSVNGQNVPAVSGGPTSLPPLPTPASGDNVYNNYGNQQAGTAGEVPAAAGGASQSAYQDYVFNHQRLFLPVMPYAQWAGQQGVA